MSLDLAPETETTVRLYAEREGVTVNELLARAFPSPQPESQPNPPASDDAVTRVRGLLRRWQQEHGLPARPDGQTHTSVQKLLAQWNAEDAQLTLEEATKEQRLWQDEQQRHQRVTI